MRITSLYRFNYIYQCLLMLLFLLGISQAQATCVKTLRWSDDAPYTFINPLAKDQVTGFTIDVVTEAFKRLNCRLNLVELPWARALLELEKGRLDILSSAYYSPERNVYAHFSQVKHQIPNLLFVRTEDLNIYQFVQLADIKKYKFRLGLQFNASSGYKNDQLLDSPEFSNLVIRNTSRKALWEMLNLSRIDGVVADKMTALYELKTMDLADKISATNLIIANEPAYFMLSKQTTNIEFVKAFDRVLQQMENEGLVDTFEQKYMQ